MRKAAYAVLVALLLFATLDFSFFYFTDYRAISKESFQYGLDRLFAYLLPREASFRSVLIDKRINQAYIYLLFYGRYDPRTLNYRELDGGEEGFVGRVGRYRFGPVDDRTIAGARLLYRVDDPWRTWYRVYERPDGTCIVRRSVVANVEPTGAERRTLFHPR